jgi:ribose 5-phosphate isomerase
MDRNEMAGWLGFERAVEALGEDLNGDLHKVIASVARDFFEQRCEFCEGTGMTNAHARIVVWENEIAKRFTRVSGTDKLGVAKLANKLLPIEICGVCRGSTVRRSGAGLGEVLEAAQKGSSTAAKKVKAGA